MKTLFASKRSKAILAIGIFAISISTISKKVISYPAGGCMKIAQEITFNKEKEITLFKEQAFFSLIGSLARNFMATNNL